MLLVIIPTAFTSLSIISLYKVSYLFSKNDTLSTEMIIVIVIIESSPIYFLYFSIKKLHMFIITSIIIKGILICKYTSIIIPIKYDMAIIKSGLCKFSSFKIAPIFYLN